jgi:hypothetical protein
MLVNFDCLGIFAPSNLNDKNVKVLALNYRKGPHFELVLDSISLIIGASFFGKLGSVHLIFVRECGKN